MNKIRVWLSAEEIDLLIGWWLGYMTGGKHLYRKLLRIRKKLHEKGDRK